MTRFGDHFLNIKRDAKNWVIPGETAVTTIIDALVRKVKRREETHCPAEILQCERAGFSRHSFELLVGLRGDQMLETMDRRRFSLGQNVQSFDERHQNNLVRAQTLAKAKRAGR